MPPARLHEMLRSRADLSTLRAVMLGGSPAGPQLLRTASNRLGPIVWQGYGQAEAGVMAILTPEDIATGDVTSVGRPLPGVEVAIVDGEIRLAAMRIRDRCEEAGRSVTQLVLGTYLVWDARRRRLCERYFDPR